MYLVNKDLVLGKIKKRYEQLAEGKIIDIEGFEGVKDCTLTYGATTITLSTRRNFLGYDEVYMIELKAKIKLDSGYAPDSRYMIEGMAEDAMADVKITEESAKANKVMIIGNDDNEESIIKKIEPFVDLVKVL